MLMAQLHNVPSRWGHNSLGNGNINLAKAKRRMGKNKTLGVVQSGLIF
jgi:hypothetical protein